MKGHYQEDDGYEDRDDIFYNFDDLENDVKYHYKYFDIGYLHIKCVTDKREYVVSRKSEKSVKRNGNLIFIVDTNKLNDDEYHC